MKLFVIGDLHIGDLPYFILSSAARTTKFRALRLASTHYISQLISEHSADQAIILGDVFHSGGDTSLSLLESAELKAYSSIAPHVRVLVGNHDYLENGDKLLSLFFNEAIDKPRYETDGDALLIFYPYLKESCSYPIDESALMEQFLGGVKEQQKKVYIFMHNDLSEWYSQIQGINKGLSWRLIEEKIRRLLNPVSLLGIDGHLHSYLRLDSLLVLGSLIKSTFKTAIQLIPSEALKQEQGGLCFIDTDKDQIEVFSNPYSPVFIQLDSRKYAFGDWAIEKLEAFKETNKSMIFLEVLVDEGMREMIPKESLEKLTDGFRIRLKRSSKKGARKVGSANFEDLSTKELIEYIKNKIASSASSQKVVEAAEAIFSPVEVDAIIEALKEDV